MASHVGSISRDHPSIRPSTQGIEGTTSVATQAKYSEILTAVREQLEDITPDLTLQQVLDKTNVPEGGYLKALHWIKTKTGQPVVLQKRTKK